MGSDYQLVVYLGAALADVELAKVAREAEPKIEFLRHLPSLISAEAHVIALYERSQPSEPLETADGDQEATLSQRFKAAWTANFATIKKSFDQAASNDEPRGVALTQALSGLRGKAIWLCQGDHSLVGGYARFEGGKLVDQAAPNDMFVSGDGYVEIPTNKLAADLAQPVVLGALYFEASTPEPLPPLIDPHDPERHIPFDRTAFEDSMI